MAGVLVLISHQTLASTIINGDFASGDFTGWATIGNVQVQPASNQGNNFGTIKPPATNHGILGSGTLPTDQLIGGNPVSAANLENFLGLTSGSLNQANGGAAGSGSAIKATFSAIAGEQISFDWNFFNNADPRNPQNDISFAVFDNTLIALANTHSPFHPTEASNIMLDETGYNNLKLNILTSGDHTISFGIVDGGALGGSALAVTNVQTIPLPAAVWLFLGGFISLLKLSSRSNLNGKSQHYEFKKLGTFRFLATVGNKNA